MQILIYYLIGMNILSLILMGVDKYKAIHGEWRISEATLMLVSLIGGSIGGLLGMFLFHHKTRHPKFTVGIPVFLVIDVIAVYLLWRFVL